MEKRELGMKFAEMKMAFRLVPERHVSHQAVTGYGSRTGSRPFADPEVYAPAVAVFANGAVGVDCAVAPKYRRYERCTPYMTGKTASAVDQPK